jgi:HAD superfamily hydrolase (TIGR01509 family)
MPYHFDAVLFDLDGTLIDSEPLGMRGLGMVLARYGHTMPADFGQRVIGRRAYDNATMMIEHFALPHTVEELIAEKRTLINTLIENEVEAMPGAGAILRELRGRGVRTAVATSSSRPYLRMILAKFGWTELFDATVTGEEVAHGKPAPDIFLRAAELLDVPPARCLVVEDAPHGVAAGIASGATTLAIPNSVTAPLQFPAGARRITALATILDLLDGARP